jgi:hypothetical protein
MGKVPTPEMGRSFVQSVTTAAHTAGAKESADDSKK